MTNSNHDDPFGLPPLKEPHEDITNQDGARYYHRLTQGSEEWHDLRRGLITASTMNLILTPTLKLAANNTTRTLLYELAAQRITGKTEIGFVSYDMERGKLAEVDAREVYSKNIADVSECGFVVTETTEGATVGYSPDGLVGMDGQIEIKSRLPKYQVKTIVEHMAAGVKADTVIPPEFMLQVQAGLFVTGRIWCDFVTHSNGFNMAVIRCHPLHDYQEAIAKAVTAAEEQIQRIVREYQAITADKNATIWPVDWVDYHEEITV